MELKLLCIMSSQNDEIGGIKRFQYFLRYIMCLPFILKFVILLLFISEGLVSVQCVAEILVCLVIPIAPDSLWLRAGSLKVW
jgi:hypothetical protein